MNARTWERAVALVTRQLDNEKLGRLARQYATDEQLGRLLRGSSDEDLTALVLLPVLEQIPDGSADEELPPCPAEQTPIVESNGQSPGAPDDMSEQGGLVQPREIRSGGDRFFCEIYKCSLSAKACAKRQDVAQSEEPWKPGKLVGQFPSCRKCSVGNIVKARIGCGKDGAS